MTTAKQVVPEHELLVLKWLSNQIDARYKVVKAIAGVGYDNGDSHTFRSPVDGQRLGKVGRESPEPRWVITDQKAFDAWLDDHYAEPDMQVRADCWPEAMAVLAEHAPHLLEEVIRVRAGAVEEVVAACKRERRAVAPGIERVMPEGAVYARPDTSSAGEAIRVMREAGIIDWLGRPALEAGGDAA